MVFLAGANPETLNLMKTLKHDTPHHGYGYRCLWIDIYSYYRNFMITIIAFAFSICGLMWSGKTFKFSFFNFQIWCDTPIFKIEKCILKIENLKVLQLLFGTQLQLQFELQLQLRLCLRFGLMWSGDTFKFSQTRNGICFVLGCKRNLNCNCNGHHRKKQKKLTPQKTNKNHGNKLLKKKKHDNQNHET